MNKLRVIIRDLDEKKMDEMWMKIFNFLVEEGVKLTNITLINKEFDQYMESIFERRNYKSDFDVEFTHSDEIINKNTEYFRKCWENGMSPYKALTFLDIQQ